MESAHSALVDYRVSRPSLKIPRENNRFLCWPSASHAPQLLAENASVFSSSAWPDWFASLRQLARNDLLESIRDYNQSDLLRRDSSPSISIDQPWIVGGHQPELFHPGVWFKNFLLAELAQQNSAAAIHILIDHDVAKSDSLRCLQRNPSPQAMQPLYLQKSVLLPIRPESQPPQPWHATPTGAVSWSDWQAALDAVRYASQSCGIEKPLLISRADVLRECIEQSENFGEAFSRFRRCIEVANGVHNLEVNLGRLCERAAFGQFVYRCLAEADKLWSAYTDCRTAYRARHGIRNPTQPVLPLQQKNEWLELPFWIYRVGGAAPVERKRLWVRITATGFELSDAPESSQATIQEILPKDVAEFSEAWNAFLGKGICLRPRALMTTLYLRCFVADLFVHGIGGGLYDELTDDILQSWLGPQAPLYLTSSASLHLPIQDIQEQESELELENGSLPNERIAVPNTLHAMRSTPERFLNPVIDDQRALAEAHEQHLLAMPPRGQKKAWHDRMKQLKAAIYIQIEPMRQNAKRQLEQIQQQSQQSRLRTSREYSFVLFEEQDVVPRLRQLASQAVASSSFKH